MVFSSQTGDVERLLKKYKYKFEKLEEKKIFMEILYVYLIKRALHNNS